MELRHIRYFVTLARELHFSRAADELEIAQPGLSHQIRQFERELGAQLFTRTTRSIQLTDAGAALLPVAQNIIDQVRTIPRVIERASEGAIGTVRIGFVASAAIAIIPKFVKLMRTNHPQVDLELHEGTTTQILHGLERKTYDIGLIRESMAYPADVTTEGLSEESLTAVVPSGHHLAERESVRLKDLSGETLITFNHRDVAGLYQLIEGILNRKKVFMKHGQDAVQLITMVGLVAAHSGIAIIPDSLRVLSVPGVHYIPLADKCARTALSLAIRTDDQKSPLITNTVTRIREAAGKHV